jgi:hypothetical protein
MSFWSFSERLNNDDGEGGNRGVISGSVAKKTMMAGSHIIFRYRGFSRMEVSSEM